MLVEKVDDRYVLFLVLGNGNQRFVVVGHREVSTFSGVLRHFDGGEHSLDLVFDGVYIDVSHDNDSLLVGAVPFFIIVTQCLIGEVVHHFHGSDGEAVCILAVLVENGQYGFIHTHHGSHACAPFFVDDSAFLVDFFRIKGQVVGPVVKDQQTGVNYTFAGNGDVIDVIDRFVDGSVGIQVGSKLHSDAFQPFTQGIVGEMGCSVETHVFQEVGQTALVVVFQNGTYLLGNIEVSLFFRQSIVTDVIGESIVQFTDAYVGINRNRRHLLLGKCHCCSSRKQDSNKCFSD